MRRIPFVCTLVFPALLLCAVPAGACGDKLLVLGRGIRIQVEGPARAASILLFAPPGSPSSAAFSDPKFQSAIRDAGHNVRAVGDRQGFEQALHTGDFDIILADLADAPTLEQPIQSAHSKPVLLPVVLNRTKSEASMAQKRYGCVIKAPGRIGHYLAAIDKAMELKSKRDRLKVVAAN